MENMDNRMWWVSPGEFPADITPPYKVLITVEGKIHDKSPSTDQPVTANLQIQWGDQK
jgi:hypothetical protein